MDLTRTIGARITVAREAAGLTQRELAERAGLTQHVSVSRYERGVARPDLETAARLARALEVSLDWLATGQGQGPA